MDARMWRWIVAGALLQATPLRAEGGPRNEVSVGAGFTEFKAKNGLEVVSLESRKVPLVTIVLCAKAGAMTETPQTRGLTHLWEHMFFKGNARLKDQETFNKRIRELGITFNGDTSAEKVRYYFTLPSVFLEEGLQFMADAISTPLLEKAELERERLVVLDEYDRSAAQPGFDLQNLQRKMTYGDQDYQRDPLGLRPIIEKATREQLLQIKTEVFVPENMALLIAGDFSAAALPPLVEKYFSHWQTPKGWQRPKRPAFPAYPQTQEFVMTRPAVQNATIQIAYAGPRARTESEDTFAADVLAHLLGQRSGKFFQKYVESGLTFGAGLSYYTQSEAGEVELFAQTTPENAVKVKDMLLAEVNEWMKPDYFSKNALEDVRLQLVVNHQREQNQPSEFVKTLAFWWAITGFDYYRSYIPSLQKIEFAQIKAFVQKYLVDKPHLTMTLLSPEDAERVKLKDTSVELVKKYLGDYARGS